MAKTTLLNFWNSNEVASLRVVGFSFPTGQTYTQNLTDEGEDYCDLHDLIENGLSNNPVWDLTGEVDENGVWVWDGEGDFRDSLGNSYSQLAVFPDAKNDSAKPNYTVIEICVDGVWAGSGKLQGDGYYGYQIVDCGAQFGDDQDESEAVYEAIEDALDNGEDEITVDGKRITWTITVPA